VARPDVEKKYVHRRLPAVVTTCARVAVAAALVAGVSRPTPPYICERAVGVLGEAWVEPRSS